MDYTIKIECRNACFYDGPEFNPMPELAAIVRRIAADLDSGFVPRGVVRDSLGNVVGETYTTK